MLPNLGWFGRLHLFTQMLVDGKAIISIPKLKGHQGFFWVIFLAAHSVFIQLKNSFFFSSVECPQISKVVLWNSAQRWVYPSKKSQKSRFILWDGSSLLQSFWNGKNNNNLSSNQEETIFIKSKFHLLLVCILQYRWGINILYRIYRTEDVSQTYRQCTTDPMSVRNLSHRERPSYL